MHCWNILVRGERDRDRETEREKQSERNREKKREREIDEKERERLMASFLLNVPPPLGVGLYHI